MCSAVERLNFFKKLCLTTCKKAEVLVPYVLGKKSKGEKERKNQREGENLISFFQHVCQLQPYQSKIHNQKFVHPKKKKFRQLKKNVCKWFKKKRKKIIELHISAFQQLASFPLSALQQMLLLFFILTKIYIFSVLIDNSCYSQTLSLMHKIN